MSKPEYAPSASCHGWREAWDGVNNNADIVGTTSFIAQFNQTTGRPFRFKRGGDVTKLIIADLIMQTITGQQNNIAGVQIDRTSHIDLDLTQVTDTTGKDIAHIAGLGLSQGELSAADLLGHQ